jgi:glucosamine 6-phosphate synthetase-like amidotransferase/phosphosugar isomerase protein
MLETMRYGIYGYEIEEFFHGIYNSINKDTYIMYLGSDGEYKEKVRTLKTVLDEITSHQFIITKQIDDYEPTPKDCIIPFVDDPDFSVFEYIIPIQIIASIIPYELGINPFFASDPLFHSKVGSKLANVVQIQ